MTHGFRIPDPTWGQAAWLLEFLATYTYTCIYIYSHYIYIYVDIEVNKNTYSQQYNIIYIVYIQTPLLKREITPPPPAAQDTIC